MTLPVAWNPISLSQANVELGLAAGANITMNDAAVRSLFGIPSGAISLHDGHGKTRVTPTVEYLVVAGGGGGGGHLYSSSLHGGGGGAGGLLTATGYAVTAGSPITVTVGAGGAAGGHQNAGATSGGNGGNSVFGSITATGGGGGAYPGQTPGNGGSGGGAGASFSTELGGTGTAGQGYAGGGNNYPAVSYYFGGGGGAGGAGTHTGAGAGVASSITGASVNYAQGGYHYGTPSPGTRGSGGMSGVQYIANSDPGSAGIVVVRYSNVYPAASATTGSPTYANTGGYHTYTWTANGSITI